MLLSITPIVQVEWQQCRLPSSLQHTCSVSLPSLRRPSHLLICKKRSMLWLSPARAAAAAVEGPTDIRHIKGCLDKQPPSVRPLCSELSAVPVLSTPLTIGCVGQTNTPMTLASSTARRLAQLMTSKAANRRSAGTSTVPPVLSTHGRLIPSADLPVGPAFALQTASLVGQSGPLLQAPPGPAHVAMLSMLRTHGVSSVNAYSINLAVTRQQLPTSPAAVSALLISALATWDGILPRADVLAVLAACPLLLHQPSKVILAKLNAASIALGLQGTAAAVKLSAEGPYLLVRVLEDPEWLHGRLAVLRELLDLPRPVLAHMVALCPRLLLMRPEAVAAHLGELTSALNATPLQASRAVAKWPSLLTLDGGALAERAENVRAALGMRSKAFATVLLRCPPLLAQPPGTLSRKRAALCQLLLLSSQKIDRVVFHYPWVLSQNVDTVADHVAALAQLLGLSSNQVGQLLFQIPNLLGFKPDTLALKVAQLSTALGRGQASTIDIIVGKPAVLASSVEKVARAWRVISALAATSSDWAASLKALSPASLGLVITSSERRLLRVRYLEAMGLQSQMSFVTALVRPDTFFHDRYPEYKNWSEQWQQLHGEV